MSDSHHGHSGGSNRSVLTGLCLVFVAYLVLLFLGLPQKWTQAVVDAQSHHAAGDHGAADSDHDAQHQDGAQHDEAMHADHEDAHNDTSVDEDEATGHDSDTAAHEHEEAPEAAAASTETDEHTLAAGDTPAEGHGAAKGNAPPIWTVLPFALLLLCIAVLPLIPATEHWWESNANRFYVAFVLGVITLTYYMFMHGSGVEGHFPAHHVVEHNGTGTNFHIAWTVFANAIFGEYIAFIVLLFSLFTISGGIRIEGDLKAHPMTNVTFIAIGGLLASFIGTTGAAMLLIRPLIETNRERKHVVHTVIFFIFVVCNCGGCLLPIGDPPLFLGYLRGVPFMWTFNLWAEWLFVNAMLLAIYFAWDYIFCYPREAIKDIVRDETQVKPLRIMGLWPNALLLVGVILSVALLDPSKTLGGWHPWFYIREVVQLVLVALSLAIGSKQVREANQFNYHAIIEVAALFFGIFICMQAPLQILGEKGSELGLDSSQEFFWATGGLSAVLDNAPTYVVFFTTAQSLSEPGATGTVAGVDALLLAAISLGAVFMGAMTYIGNGPNFMVKAIAEQSGIKMPSFFGYMIYSFLVLLPVLIITTLIFL